MPAQMPYLSMAVECRSTITMPIPGAMPSWMTPRTSPVNGSGTVPRSTVAPVTGWPAAGGVAWTGYAVAHSGRGSAPDAAGEETTVVTPRHSPAAVVRVARARPRRRTLLYFTAIGPLQSGRATIALAVMTAGGACWLPTRIAALR